MDPISISPQAREAVVRVPGLRRNFGRVPAVEGVEWAGAEIEALSLEDIFIARVGTVAARL